MNGDGDLVNVMLAITFAAVILVVGGKQAGGASCDLRAAATVGPCAVGGTPRA
jgi:hypothetical protein